MRWIAICITLSFVVAAHEGARAATITIGFDVDPAGAPIADGTVLDTVYLAAYGVTLARVESGMSPTCAGTTEVFAHTQGDFASSPNVVSLCGPGEVFSNFSSGVGMIEVALLRDAVEVCIAVDPQSGGNAILQIVDGGGVVQGFVTSASDATESLCIQGAAIDRVRFTGPNNER